jgi:very-short-patch-repair endonuclease
MPHPLRSNSKTKHHAFELRQEAYNEERTKYLESLGYKVIPKGDDVRFWNNDVLNDIEGVILAIMDALKDK